MVPGSRAAGSEEGGTASPRAQGTLEGRGFLLVDIRDMGSSGSRTLADAAADVVGKLSGVRILEFGTMLLDSDERTFRECLVEIERADLVIMRLHSGAFNFKKYDRFIEHARECGANIFLHSNIPEDLGEVRDLFRLGEEDRRLLRAYIELGGERNEAAIVAWAINRLRGSPLEVPEPHRPRTEGLYHPELREDIGIDEYVARHDTERPVIGLMFHQDLWLSGNLEGVDRLILEMERNDDNVIALFFSSAPDQMTGALGVRETIKRYLVSDKGPRVDVLIINTGFSQLVLSDPGDGGPSRQSRGNFFQDLGVPVLQVMNTYQTAEAWEGNDQGLLFFELSTSVVWPEYDGQVITFPVASTETGPQGGQAFVPLSSRVRKLARMAHAWARLRRTPVAERRVAILLHQNPPRNDTIGDAFGLDAPQSTVDLIRRLKELGYRIDDVPEEGNELVHWLLSRISNDTEWLTPQQMHDRAAALVERKRYESWFQAVPAPSRDRMVEDWGEPPGELFELEGSIIIPGVMNGNIFIGLQPPRSDFQSLEADYHRTDLVMPHNYLAYYHWIEKVFSAHAIVHMGCHGTLEWLPGKSVGLSDNCYPDIVLGDLPNIYPYIVGNPGEGIQAKRRSGAVLISHLPPALTRADLYGDLSGLEADLQAFMRARTNGESEKAAELLGSIREAALQANILPDLGLDDARSLQDLEQHVGTLYDYLSQVKDSLIKDGLHVLGTVPEGQRLEEMVYAVTRLDNGAVPSLRTGMAKWMGLDLQALQDRPEACDLDGELNGARLDRVDAEARELIGRMSELDFETKVCLDLVSERYPGASQLVTTSRFICGTLVPDIRATASEMDLCLCGLEGGYVPPGPSGVISRGNAHILPTGRNFYSIDPGAVPTSAAWEVGKRMADQMVQRHIKEDGRYPESVGIVVFATDTMKTGGDDVAYILWLMGLRPRWAAKGGKVLGLEVIPVEELGRPRIDVTLRISGLFRDSFPNLVELIDEGVEMVADLQESDQENYLRKHLQEDMVESIKSGLKADEARAKALIRIFGDPPCTYGGGVDRLVESSKWSSTDDLGEVYVEWGGHAYGRGRHGERAQESFAKRLGSLDVTVKNHNSRELDILDNDDDYIFHGGMVAAARTYGKEAPLSVVGDSADPKRTGLRTVAEEAGFVFRRRVLNPKWLEGLKPHGYRGAREVSALVDFAFGWDATSDVIEAWMYEGMAERFLLDQENREWLEQNNPEAVRQMSGRLLEAIDRGMWEATQEMRQRLESIYLSQEERLEGGADRP
ncbi:MAG: cobaltochelatase subunit CobN [Methanomassiliicoccales archaeon]|nr:cobaltochelatase subunit CobN [Methanomassiliicoccales archaeon]